MEHLAVKPRPQMMSWMTKHASVWLYDDQQCHQQAACGHCIHDRWKVQLNVVGDTALSLYGSLKGSFLILRLFVTCLCKCNS